MLKLASFLIVAAALPALADAPAAPASATPKIIYNFYAPGAKCYFIRQANRQLQSPQDKPVFLPIAGAEKLAAAAPFENCMSDQRTIKTVIKK
jgi:hypothetical protein